ncbi:ABC transporter permease subunit [Candidatus Microgenomates bacterium]|nr:ABC transporter permease subunit [Candidatus Microgenomates bacterium]
MKAIYKKELGHFFNNPLGFIVIVLFALFGNFLFIKDIFSVGSASMRPFFVTTGWLLTILVPALAMRGFAEEKRTNTLETLLTLPLREWDIVFGKTLAIITVTAIALALTMGLPIALALIAHLYLPEILIGYLGILLMSAAFTSIALFFSLKTNNQIVAFFISAVVLFILMAFSGDFVASFIPRSLSDSVVFLMPPTHIEPFIKGILDLRSIVYFLMLIGLFTYLTASELEGRQ